MNAPEIVRLDIPNSTKYVSVVRQTVEGVAKKLEFSSGDIEDVKLAVGEACTNAVRHGKQRRNRVNIRCAISRRGLEIEIRNSVTDGSCAPAVIAAPDPVNLTEGGLGLYLMKQLMDEVELCWHKGRAKVKMLKRTTDSTAYIDS